jgi:hypothetical protein
VVEVGSHVRFVDQKGVERDALVQVAHTQQCVNLVFVSGDEKRTDNYGRQVQHETSVSHRTQMEGVPGFFWYDPKEEKVKA